MHLPTCLLIFLFVSCSQISQTKADFFKNSVEWAMTHIGNLLDGHGWNGDPERKAAIQKGNEEFIRCGGGLNCVRPSSESARQNDGETPTQESARCVEHQDELIHWIRHQIAEWIRRRNGGGSSTTGTSEQTDEMDSEIDEDVAELTENQKTELIKWIKQRLGNYHSESSNGNVGQGANSPNCNAYKERIVNLLIEKMGESTE